MTLSEEELLNVIKCAPLVSIDLIIRNGSGEILLGFRKREPAKDTWFVPGGRVRAEDKDLSAAFNRIAHNELGKLGEDLELKDAHLLTPVTHHYATNFANRSGIATHYAVLPYQVQVAWGGEDLDKLPKDQHSDWKFMSVECLTRHDEVHRYTKMYFAAPGFGGICPSASTPGGLTQYKAVAEQHVMHETLLWQVPAFCLAVQAFLVRAAFEATVPHWGHAIAAGLALTAAVGSLYLLYKQRKMAVREGMWLERFEILNRSSGLQPVHAKPQFHGLAKVSAYHIWVFVLGLFLIADALIMDIAICQWCFSVIKTFVRLI